MNVIRSNRVIEDNKTISIFNFKEPMKPSPPVFGELEQKISLMAPMRDVPYLPWDIVSICPCHGYIDVFSLKKRCIDYLSRIIYRVKCVFTVT